MLVLVTSKFEEDPIKNERASLATPFSHYVYGKFFRRSRAPNSVGSGPNWLKFELVGDFMPILDTCTFEKNLMKKQQRKGGDIILPILSQWALSAAMETRVLIQSVPKPYEPFPHPNDASYKVWSTLASEIFKFHLNYDRMIEPRNSGRTRQIQYSPHFFKAGL